MSNEDHILNMPMALFGGTFDPVHYGHLRCAEEARQKLGLDKFCLLPSGCPPHRDAPRATVKQRLDMLRLALVEFPRLEIDDRETRRKGPSYMVDTLKEIRTEFQQRPLLLLIGQDVANHLHEWFHWQALFDLTHIVIMTRPGAKVEYRQDLGKQIERRLLGDVQELFHSQAGGVFKLKVSSFDISATTIQSIIRLGRSPHSMLPGVVLNYINENHLYLPA